MIPPVVLFAYNRPEHLRRTLAALARNHGAADHRLIVYADGPKDDHDDASVTQTRRLVRTATQFADCDIIEASTHQGLSRALISGISDIMSRYPAAIIIEDDIVTSPFFLSYMRQALSTYVDQPAVMQISGYLDDLPGPLPETFFLPPLTCWGWATWADRWRSFEPDGDKLLQAIEQRGLTTEFNFGGSRPAMAMLRDQIHGRNDSWAIRWQAVAVLHRRLALCPRQSLAQNIGAGRGATHHRRRRVPVPKLAAQPIKVIFQAPLEHAAISARYQAWLRRQQAAPTLRRRLAGLIRQQS